MKMDTTCGIVYVHILMEMRLHSDRCIWSEKLKSWEFLELLALSSPLPYHDETIPFGVWHKMGWASWLPMLDPFQYFLKNSNADSTAGTWNRRKGTIFIPGNGILGFLPVPPINSFQAKKFLLNTYYVMEDKGWDLPKNRKEKK